MIEICWLKCAKPARSVHFRSPASDGGVDGQGMETYRRMGSVRCLFLCMFLFVCLFCFGGRAHIFWTTSPPALKSSLSGGGGGGAPEIICSSIAVSGRSHNLTLLVNIIKKGKISYSGHWGSQCPLPPPPPRLIYAYAWLGHAETGSVFKCYHYIDFTFSSRTFSWRKSGSTICHTIRMMTLTERRTTTIP